MIVMVNGRAWGGQRNINKRMCLSPGSYTDGGADEEEDRRPEAGTNEVEQALKSEPRNTESCLRHSFFRVFEEDHDGDRQHRYGE
jgi:hypothetical protein